MNNLKLYAQLKQQRKELDEQIKILEPLVREQVMSVDGEKLETTYGTFSFTIKRVWIYSDKLLEKEKSVKEAIKLMKKEEELKKIAVLDQVQSNLRFTPKK